MCYNLVQLMKMMYIAKCVSCVIPYAYMMYVCNTQIDSICVTLTIPYAVYKET